MKQSTSILRGLNDIRAAYILESEIPDSAPSFAAPAEKQTARDTWRRVTSSGWFVAAVCAVVAFGTLAGIIWAGQRGPGTVNPAGTLPESTAEMQTEPVTKESITHFVDRMYQTALPAEKDQDEMEETLAPGSVLPSEYLPRVAEDVVGDAVNLSLPEAENNTYTAMYLTDGGMRLVLIACNGDLIYDCKPLLLVLDTAYRTAEDVRTHVDSLQGTVVNVHFLDSNEYMFVSNAWYALSMHSESGEDNGSAEVFYGVFQVNGDAVITADSGSATAQRIGSVYERIYERFGVTIP